MPRPRDRKPTPEPEGIIRAKPILFQAIAILERAFQGIGRNSNSQVLDHITAAAVKMAVTKAILEADSHETARRKNRP